MTKKEQQQKEQDEHEGEVVTGMASAHEIALTLFGERSNVLAVEEIYDYLDAGAEAEKFAPDLRRVYEHAKIVYKTETPTPEQVFGLFERIFGDD